MNRSSAINGTPPFDAPLSGTQLRASSSKPNPTNDPMKPTPSSRNRRRQPALCLALGCALILNACDRTPFDPSVVEISSAQRQAAQWALLGQLLEQQDPTTLSPTAADFTVAPASMVSALQALWWGTRGETALEVARLFHAEPGAGKLRAPMAVGGATGSPLGGGVVVASSTAIWPDDRFAVRPEYVQLLKQRGLGLVESVDWSNLPPALNRVNDWAKQSTGGRVDKVFEEGSLRPSVAMVLASVVGFQGTWATPFDPQATRTQDFSLLDGSKRSAAFMSASREMRYAKIDEVASLIEVPFSDGKHRLITVLPAEAGAAPLRKVEAALVEDFADWMSELSAKTVNVMLPRFSVQGSAEPRAALEALGIKRVFSDKDSDFTGASEVAGLKLDAFHQQARVKVDESGAEAVAATAATVVAKGFSTDSVEFRADRPFLYFILGDQNELLFAGRVTLPVDPSSQSGAAVSPPASQPVTTSGITLPAP
jgi:serpin B